MEFFDAQVGEENAPLLPTQNPKEEPTGCLPWIPKATSIMLGQIASLLMCFVGIFYMRLSDVGVLTSAVPMWITYLFLTIIFVPWMCFGRPDQTEEFRDVLKSRGWKYLIISMADFGGTYLISMSYHYTSLITAQFLTSFAVLPVLIMSYLCLKARYGILHYVGIAVAVSVAGLGYFIWTLLEAGTQTEETAASSTLGGILCGGGAIFAGLAFVSEEFFTKNFGPAEYLSFIGFFGFIFSGVLALTEDFSGLVWSAETISGLVGPSVSRFWFYVTVAALMVKASALTVTLSLFSTGIYTILVGVYEFNFIFHWIYVMLALLLLGGITLFSTHPVQYEAAQGCGEHSR